jgi:hypothetical protein
MVLLPAHLLLKCAAIIPMAVCWVGAGGVGGLLCEGLRVAFWTNVVSHARAMWVNGATGAMQHATCNDLKKSGVCILIRQLCRHHVIVLIGPSWFVIGVDAPPTPRRTQMWVQLKDNERERSQDALPSSQHLKGRGACWSFGMGLGRIDKLIHSHGPAHNPHKVVSA